MSKINDLIKELCPNGVTFKKLDEVCAKIYAGGTPSTSHEEYYDGNIKWLRSGEINFNELSDTETKITEAGLNNSSAKIIPSHSVVIAMTGATVARTAMIMEDMSMNQSVCALVPKNELNYRFLYQLLSNKYLELKQSGQGVLTSLNIDRIKKIIIPIPPLEVQEEIVRILDKFGNLEAELEAELEARKSQYDFWRSQMFKRKGNSKISDLFKRVKGTPITAGKMKEIEDPDGEIRIFAGGQTAVNANIEDIPKANIIKHPCVIVQSRGLIDFIYYDKPFTFKNEMWAYTCDNQVTVKYLYYCLKNNVNYFREIGKQMGSMPQISLSVTEKYEIFLPPLEEQKRIISILDRFEKLITDINDGIPAEIELRRKQYEYYRNKLLSFEVVDEEM